MSTARGQVPGWRGGTCRRSSPRGRRSGSGTTGSRPTAPWIGCWPRCRLRPTRRASWTGGSALTSRWLGCISTARPRAGRPASLPAPPSIGSSSTTSRRCGSSSKPATCCSSDHPASARPTAIGLAPQSRRGRLPHLLHHRRRPRRPLPPRRHRRPLGHHHALLRRPDPAGHRRTRLPPAARRRRRRAVPSRQPTPPEDLDRADHQPRHRQLGQVLGDDMLAAAMLDRLLDRSVVMHLDGDSYRLRSHHAHADTLRQAVRRDLRPTIFTTAQGGDFR